MKNLYESIFDQDLTNKTITIGDQYNLVDVLSHKPNVIHKHININKLRSSGYKLPNMDGVVGTMIDKLYIGYISKIIENIPLHKLKKPLRKRYWLGEWNECYSICDEKDLNKYLRRYIDNDVKIVMFEPAMNQEYIAFQIFTTDEVIDDCHITWYFEHK